MVRSGLQKIKNLYWILFVVSIVFAVASANMSTSSLGQFFLLDDRNDVFNSIEVAILQLIFYFVLLTVFANLWWVLALLYPAIFLRGQNLIVGGIISILMVCFAWFGPKFIINMQVKQLVEQATKHTVHALPNTTPRSITISGSNCDLVCQRILLGSTIGTVRTQNTKRNSATHLMYIRASSEECNRIDPFFHMNSACILAHPDDGRKSDLEITDEYQDDQEVDNSASGFSPHLVSRKIYSIEDKSARTILTASTDLVWTKPLNYIPLVPNTRSYGRSFIPLQTIVKQTGQPNLEEHLSAVGIDVAPTQPTGYSLPHEIPLVISTLNFKGTKEKSSILNAWLQRRYDGNLTLTGSEEILLAKIFGNVSSIGHDATGLFFTFMSKVLRQRTPEQNKLFAQAYLSNFHTVPDYGLRKAAGRFSFDPTPHLVENIKRSPKTRIVGTAFALIAACHADPRWSRSIVPFVLEHLYALGPSVSSVWHKKAIRYGFITLAIHKDKKAWAELKTFVNAEDFKELDIPRYDKPVECM